MDGLGVQRENTWNIYIFRCADGSHPAALSARKTRPLMARYGLGPKTSPKYGLDYGGQVCFFHRYVRRGYCVSQTRPKIKYGLG